MHCGEDYSKAATDLPSNLDALHSRLPGLQVGLRHLSHSELDSREQRQARAGSLLDLFVWPLMTTEAAEGRWPWPAAAEGIIPDNKSNPASLRPFRASESFCAALFLSSLLSTVS